MAWATPRLAAKQRLARTRTKRQQPLGLGARYRAAVREALSQIERFPEAGTRLSRRTRRRLVNRFPYGIVYRHTDDGIFVVAIAHLHRKPEYWRDRLR
ncbi:type II toxin-antitoxin system RelE/ParE family toxin [Salinisphaera japonica]|uniref:type II toxin-antitoxin system RelE/ParE family toxin n=1 Tax=Salinisphaera japonica TaxID=1304270 RepID=UPI000F4B1999